MTALDDIYTAEWVHNDFKDLGPEFEIVAKGIIREFDPEYIFDVGCGPALMVETFDEHAVRWNGIEGSAHCIAYASEAAQSRITHRDITSANCSPALWGLLRRSDGGPDLVICTEVAEHLDAKDAPGLVELLCSAMCPIVFTAAPPGQDGHHHVNCQPQEYWRDLFAAHGARQDYAATWSLGTRWGSLKRLSHMTRNLMVFI